MYEVSILLVVGFFLGILISWFYWRQQMSEREGYIDNLETSIMGQVENLNERVRDQENDIGSRNSQLRQKEEIIDGLNAQVQGQDDLINALKENVTDLEKQNLEELTRAEVAEARVGELETSLMEKEKEVVNLMERARAMLDDLAIIDGIGPKVSAVLRLAGITSFARLASIDVDGIREILEAKNPSIVRLTDPSTWPEQARMAADGDWEALTSLQENLKEARRGQAARALDSELHLNE